MAFITLSNGIKMPAIGLGTFRLGTEEETKEAIICALELGYRLIDTAAAYGNEASIGAAIRESAVKREDIFLTTKVWYRRYEPEECRRSLEESMEKLGTDYLDMVLLHWPFGNTYAAWRILEEFYEHGRIRAIGVSNFTARQIIDLRCFNKIPPMLNQVEVNLICQQKELRYYMEKCGVPIQAYAPFGEGKHDEMFEEVALKKISARHGKSVHQVILRFLLQEGIGVVPKSSSSRRMKQNLESDSFSLSEEEMNALRRLDENRPLIGLQNDAMYLKFFGKDL